MHSTNSHPTFFFPVAHICWVNSLWYLNLGTASAQLLPQKYWKLSASHLAADIQELTYSTEHLKGICLLVGICQQMRTWKTPFTVKYIVVTQISLAISRPLTTALFKARQKRELNATEWWYRFCFLFESSSSLLLQDHLNRAH